MKWKRSRRERACLLGQCFKRKQGVLPNEKSEPYEAEDEEIPYR
jgi:hypothetical protein